MKRIIPVMMAAVLTCASVPMVAKADNSKVVTLGANLSDEQKKSMKKNELKHNLNISGPPRTR